MDEGGHWADPYSCSHFYPEATLLEEIALTPSFPLCDCSSH